MAVVVAAADAGWRVTRTELGNSGSSVRRHIGGIRTSAVGAFVAAADRTTVHLDHGFETTQRRQESWIEVYDIQSDMMVAAFGRLPLGRGFLFRKN